MQCYVGLLSAVPSKKKAAAAWTWRILTSCLSIRICWIHVVNSIVKILNHEWLSIRVAQVTWRNLDTTWLAWDGESLCWTIVFLLGLVWFLCLCFFACLRSFTDWCTAHRQQSREQKRVPVKDICLAFPIHSSCNKCIQHYAFWLISEHWYRCLVSSSSVVMELERGRPVRRRSTQQGVVVMNYFLRKQNLQTESSASTAIGCSQLKCVQMNFMVDAAQKRANQNTNSDISTSNTALVLPFSLLFDFPLRAFLVICVWLEAPAFDGCCVLTSEFSLRASCGIQLRMTEDSMISVSISSVAARFFTRSLSESICSCLADFEHSTPCSLLVNFPTSMYWSCSTGSYLC